MKKILFLLCLIGGTFSTAFAQNSNPWPTSGNVGIGTSTPTLGLLHIVGNGFDLLSMSAGGGQPIQLNAYTNLDFRIVQRSNAPMTFWTNTVERLRIDQNGNLGIGTTSPSSYFHGGTNKVLEIFNSNTTLNSQSHVILSTGSTLDGSGGGTISWVSKNSTGNQGMAYIGSQIQGSATTNAAANLVFGVSSGSGIVAKMVLDKNGNLGIGTSAPTHSLTFGSTGTGLAYYNTADQTTNFERLRQYWSGNTYYTITDAGGTGSIRNLVLGTSSRMFTIANSGGPAGFFQLNSGTATSNASIAAVSGALMQSGAPGRGLAILNTISQTGTAGYQALWISPLETTVGTGVHNLIDAGTNSASLGGGTHTSKFTVDNTGNGYFSGNVGIGKTNPQEALAVNGTVHSKAVVIDLIGWSDYVFDKAYKLPSLQSVKTYIDMNHHLPDVPSANEMVTNGLDVGEMNKLLMKKVEELTLYLIEKDKQIEAQNSLLLRMQNEQRKLNTKVNKLFKRK